MCGICEAGFYSPDAVPFTQPTPSGIELLHGLMFVSQWLCAWSCI